MRTTIDLPDSLFREVKSAAASRGLKLKELVISALQDALRTPEMQEATGRNLRSRHRRLMREHFRRMDEGRAAHEPIGRLDRDSLYDRHA